jgi:hypothetical protein
VFKEAVNPISTGVPFCVCLYGRVFTIPVCSPSCAQEYYNSQLTHAFCCDTQQCRLVAQLVGLSVRKALLHPSQLTAEDSQLQVSNAADASILLDSAEADATAEAATAKAGAKAGAGGPGGTEGGVLRQRPASREPAGVTA